MEKSVISLRTAENTNVNLVDITKKGVCYMAGKEQEIQDIEVNTTDLAQVLGVTARRVQHMTQDGTIATVKRGKFNLCDAVQKYIKFLSKEAVNPEDVKLERTRRAAETTLKASKAQIAKMEADELKGTMHRSEDVAAMTEDLIYAIRAALVSLPGRLAMDVAAVDTPAEASEIIRKEVHKTMRELSRYKYDPKKYAERVRERKAWEEIDYDE